MDLRRSAVVVALVLTTMPGTAAGSELDEAFGGDGVVRAEVGVGDAQLDHAMENGVDAIVAVGRADVAGESRAVLAKWNEDGTPAAGFGVGGIAVSPVAAMSAGRSVRWTWDGGGVVGGSGDAGGFVARFGPDGALVPSFGSAGVAGFGPGAVRQVEQTLDGGYLAGGTVTEFGSTRVELRRYSADGAPDPSFGGDGVVTLFDDPLAGASFTQLLQLNDGLAVVATAYDAAVLVRLRHDGSIDPDFNGGAPVVERFGGTSASATGATSGIGWTGYRLTATRTAGGVEQPLLAVLNGDGAVTSTTLLPAGLEVAGVGGEGMMDTPRSTVVGAMDGRMTLVRTDGESGFDPAFGDGGVLQPLPEESAATGIWIQRHGQAVVTGWSECWGHRVLTVVRVKADYENGTPGDPVPCGEQPPRPQTGDVVVPPGPGDSPDPAPPAGGEGAPGELARSFALPSGVQLRLLDRRPRRGALRARLIAPRGTYADGVVRVRSRRVLMASRRFRIVGGRSTVLRVPVTKTGRRVFKAKRRVALQASVRAAVVAR